MLVLKLFLNVKQPVSPVHGSSDVHSCEPNKRNDGSEYILLQNEVTAANQRNHRLFLPLLSLHHRHCSLAQYVPEPLIQVFQDTLLRK